VLIELGLYVRVVTDTLSSVKVATQEIDWHLTFEISLVDTGYAQTSSMNNLTGGNAPIIGRL